MQYRKFIIRNYRGIIGPLEIDVHRTPLRPIIGVNESGKTTVLQAIFAFDHYNDTLNDGGRHLQDTENLYDTAPNPPTISAEVEVTYPEFVELLAAIDKEDTVNSKIKDGLKSYRARKVKVSFPDTVTITRDLRTKKYDIESELLPNNPLNHHIALQALYNLPYILYFDDFRDSIEERIEIIKKPNDGGTSGWLSIMEQLFKKTDPSFSVFDLAKKEERQRRTILARVEHTLNATLTREWQTFRLDEVDRLEIAIGYEQDPVGENGHREFLKLEVIETDPNGYRHFFFIRDRSKGFYWFFNFVMKLEFNPKTVSASDANTIYLLDEPGSYLHAAAQSKLCAKLKSLSQQNRVLYCTHSHYLLNPEIIPLNSISVADKKDTGNIELVPIHQHKGPMKDRRSAYQPVTDALQIKPFVLDMSHTKVLITEGISDYYAFEMFKRERDINVLPSAGADNSHVHISNMIAWQVEFYALWDNDDSGRNAKQKAEEHFGQEMAQQRFYLLLPPSGTTKNRCKLEDLFAELDKDLIMRELGIPQGADFKKVIASLYYAPNREDILGKISQVTSANFDAVFTMMGIN